MKKIEQRELEKQRKELLSNIDDMTKKIAEMEAVKEMSLSVLKLIDVVLKDK